MQPTQVKTHTFQRTRRPFEVLPPVELTTSRLQFRPLAMADAGRVIAAVRHSRETLADRIPLNREGEPDHAMFRRWVESAAEGDANRTAWRRAAFLDSGTFVGAFNLIKIEHGLEWTCEATWWVDRRFTGHGYASEGVDALMHFATADIPVGLGLTRVRAMIQPNNPASLRIAAKTGLRDTGETELLPIGDAYRLHTVHELTV